MSTLAINNIRRDGGTQMRVSINEDAVDSYAERMEAGDEFPPVVVFHDGAAYWLADGFHRLAARCKAAVNHNGDEAWSVIESDVRAGTRQDAIRFAIAANRTNGLRRTNADKQVAVRAALAHPDMQGMSNEAVAVEVGVSEYMVRQHRNSQVRENRTCEREQIASTHKAVNTATDRRLGTDGKSYPVKAKQQPKPQEPSRQPEEKQDAAPRAAVSTRHICPTCNGEGFIE